MDKANGRAGEPEETALLPEVLPPQRDRKGKFLPGHMRLGAGGRRKGIRNKLTLKLFELVEGELERRGLAAIRSVDDETLLKLAALIRSNDDSLEDEAETRTFKSTQDLIEHTVKAKTPEELVEMCNSMRDLADKIADHAGLVRLDPEEEQEPEAEENDHLSEWKRQRAMAKERLRNGRMPPSDGDDDA